MCLRVGLGAVARRRSAASRRSCAAPAPRARSGREDAIPRRPIPAASRGSSPRRSAGLAMRSGRAGFLAGHARGGAGRVARAVEAPRALPVRSDDPAPGVRQRGRRRRLRHAAPQHAGDPRGQEHEHAHAPRLHADPLLHGGVAAAREEQRARADPLRDAGAHRRRCCSASASPTPCSASPWCSPTLAGCAIVLADPGQGGVRPRAVRAGLGPAAVPTFLLWTAFVCASFAVTGNRYGAYGLGLGAMALTGFFQARGKMSWAFNWDLWSAVRWSDISVFELDRTALVLNRVDGARARGALHRRSRCASSRAASATRRASSTRCGRAALARAGAGARCRSPPCRSPAVSRSRSWCTAAARAPWRASCSATTGRRTSRPGSDAKSPSLAAADLDLEIDPKRGWLRSQGRVHAGQPRPRDTLSQVAVTGGPHWRNVRWTMDGDAAKPEDRARLYVFTPKQPLAPGDRVRIGFEFEGRYPDGISKNGARPMEFVLPSGVGADRLQPHRRSRPIARLSCPRSGIERGQEPDRPARVPGRLLEASCCRPALPMFDGWCDTRIRVTAPGGVSSTTSTGALVSEKVEQGQRITEWRSDAPVRAFNVVLGQLEGEARRRRGGLLRRPPPLQRRRDARRAGAARAAGTASGSRPTRGRSCGCPSSRASRPTRRDRRPTSRSRENIGFLTKSEPKANAAFWITAHEAAHQWWPCMAMPGDGPGGDVLSEGMAHFSTILLTEQARGLEQRIAFCRSIEDRYGEHPPARLRAARSSRSTARCPAIAASSTTAAASCSGCCIG